MNKDAVRINQIDLPAAFPSLRLLELLRTAYSVPCLIVAAAVYAGLQLDFGASFKSESLDLTATASPLISAPLTQVIFNIEAIFVYGSTGGVAMLAKLAFRMLCLGFGAVGIARFTALMMSRGERCGVLRTARFCAACWRSILVSAALAIGLGLIGLLFFRVIGLVASWCSGGAGEASIPNLVFWMSSFLLLIGLYVLSIGWLLGISAIAVDRVDGAEALSRGISFVLSRFRRATCFVIIIGLIAKLAALMTWWAMTLSGKIAQRSISESVSGTTGLSAGFESFRTWSVETVQLSAVCCGLAIAYVILRQVVDNVDFREISDQK